MIKRSSCCHCCVCGPAGAGVGGAGRGPAGTQEAAVGVGSDWPAGTVGARTWRRRRGGGGGLSPMHRLI
jgi:hypothetical protein